MTKTLPTLTAVVLLAVAPSITRAAAPDAATGTTPGSAAADRIEPKRVAGSLTPAQTAKTKEAVAKGVKYLLAAQKDTGAWGEEGNANPATTALVVRAIIGTGEVDGRHPAVASAIKYLLTYRQADGGFYKTALKNYNTAICMMAFHAAGAAEHKDIVAAAQKFLLAGQYGADEHIDELANPASPAKKNPNYGGNGYGQASHQFKADMSNTSFLAEALQETGLPKDHPSWKRMQTFLSRMQLRSESNDQPYAKDAGDDGGFIYELDESKAPKYTDPKTGKELLRSYGSMTYAGLKTFIYAGLSKDDPRVKSALAWASRNWTLDENPYMKASGLFYYYMTLARALHVAGVPTITDARTGVAHAWRPELAEKLASLQQADGSWFNAEKRWMEGDSKLVTSYALLALVEVLK